MTSLSNRKNYPKQKHVYRISACVAIPRTFWGNWYLRLSFHQSGPIHKGNLVPGGLRQKRETVRGTAEREDGDL